MKKIYYTAFLLISFLSTESQISTTGVVSLGDGTMSVKIDLNTSISQVKVTLSGPSLRWISVGLDCDLMFGQHDCLLYTDGFHDAQMTGAHTAPLLDPIENWTLLTDQIVSGIRTIEVVRNFDSGDPTDFIFNGSLSTLNIIWAFASQDTTTLFYHADNFGIATLYFNDLNVNSNTIKRMPLIVFKKPNFSIVCLENNSGNEIKEVTVYSIHGQLVKKYIINQTQSSKIEIQIDGLKNGTYIVQSLFANNKTVFNQIVCE